MTENNGAIKNHKRSKEVREWVTAQVEDRESVALPELAHEAVEYFSQDEGFVRDILAEVLEPACYKIASYVLSNGRPSHGVVLLGDDLVSREQFDKEASALQKRFAKWWEHAGDRHYHFMKMNKEQLRLAAEERENRARTEYFVATFERR